MVKKQEDADQEIQRQQEEFEKQASLLNKLGSLEEFRVWRDLVVEENLKMLKAELQNPLGLSEAELKAKLLHYNSLENFFYKVFEQVKDQN